MSLMVSSKGRWPHFNVKLHFFCEIAQCLISLDLCASLKSCMNKQYNHSASVYLQFPWILDMEPYTAEGMARIEEAEELTSLSKPSSSPLPPSPSPVPPSPRADSSSGEPSFSLRNSLEVTTSAALPANNNQINYELVGIVVHSGQANAGHYYSFIKDRR